MPTAPVEFVSIDFLGPLRKTKDGNEHLLFIYDRFTKLTAVVPLKTITAYSVARAFVHNWVHKYGPPAILLSDNGKQFASKYLTAICQILGTSNVFTTAYHPQTNGQAERCNRTLLCAIRRYVSEELDDWDQYCNALKFAYNCQVHPSIGFSPFELVLTRPPCHMGIEKLERLETPERTKTQLRTAIMAQVKRMVKCAGENLKKAQAHVRQTAEQLAPGDFVFVRREAPIKGERSKLASRVTGPYKVLRTLPRRVSVQTNTGYEYDVSYDRVVKAPRKPESTDVRTEQQLAPKDTVGIPAAEFRERVSTGATAIDSRNRKEETYFVDRLVSIDQPSNTYRVRWAGYGPDDDTWEPPSNITFNLILRYHRRRKTKIPHTVAEKFPEQVKRVRR